MVLRGHRREQSFNSVCTEERGGGKPELVGMGRGSQILKTLDQLCLWWGEAKGLWRSRGQEEKNRRKD